MYSKTCIVVRKNVINNQIAILVVNIVTNNNNCNN